jgi:glutamyl-tRNA synthetase
LLKIAPIIQERMVTLDEAVELAGFLFKETIEYDPKELIAKGLTAEQSAEAARKSLQVLSGLPVINPQTGEPPMRALIEELGLSAGQVFGILRVATSGQKVSPPLFESMEIIGREKVLERVRQAVELLDALK